MSFYKKTSQKIGLFNCVNDDFKWISTSFPGNFKHYESDFNNFQWIDKDLNKFLKACFVQPRKKLSKNLGSLLEKSKILALYEELDLNDNLRPHEVSSSLYSQMHTKVKNGRDK